MNIHIDKSKKIPLYRQIAEQIQAQIVSGEIPEGFRFPSERQLADALGVNRTTILNAYKELKADGLMDSHVGRGTIAVRPERSRPEKHPYSREPMWEYLFSDYMKHHDTFDAVSYTHLDVYKRQETGSYTTIIPSGAVGLFERFDLYPLESEVQAVSGFYLHGHERETPQFLCLMDVFEQLLHAMYTESCGIHFPGGTSDEPA